MQENSFKTKYGYNVVVWVKINVSAKGRSSCIF